MLASVKTYACILTKHYRSSIIVNMNRLSTEDRIRIIAALVEGVSIRSIVRMTGFSKNTIAKLLVEAGAACAVYQDQMFRSLKLKRIQCDEIWSFIQAKDKNVPANKQAPAENIRRAPYNKTRRTICRMGHLYGPRDLDSDGKHRCKTCMELKRLADCPTWAAKEERDGEMS